LLQHERFVAFSEKYLAAKGKRDKCEKALNTTVEQKCLAYREAKPGGNPQFILEGYQILMKCWEILQYTFLWGYFNIPAKLCAQKSIYEWQIKSYEKLATDLETALSLDVHTIDHLKTKHLYKLIENSLIKKIEEAEDLLALFSEESMGDLGATSFLGRWTCQHCNYNNHPKQQEKQCGHCSKPRPEIKVVWFPTD